jgi:hypothetical protein
MHGSENYGPYGGHKCGIAALAPKQAGVGPGREYPLVSTLLLCFLKQLNSSCRKRIYKPKK